MQAEAEALHAKGIVGVQLRQRCTAWGGHARSSSRSARTVPPLREDHVDERPTMVLSFDN